MAITATQLRADIYNLLDQVVETGEPLEMGPKGATVRLVPSMPINGLTKLAPMPGLNVVGPDAIVGVDESDCWTPEDT